MLYQIVFSPTGGTRKVADILCAKLEEQYVTVDLCDAQKDFAACTFTPQDVCVAAVPSYAGRVPETAIRRLSQLRGNGARAVLVTVYGNREYEDTLVELQDTLQAAGFVPVAAVAALAEHSIARSVAAGRPDAQDVTELESYVPALLARLQAEEPAPLTVPGNRPYKAAGPMAVHPAASEACTGCGICADSCPVQAIPADRPNETDNAVCITCMRCVAVCPSKARSLPAPVQAAMEQKLGALCAVRKSNALI